MISDLRLAIRSLRRNAGFATLAIGCLALGLGANTMIFSIVSAVLLRPLPFPQPDRIVSLREVNIKGNAIAVSEPDFRDWLERARSFSAMAGYEIGPTTVLGADRAVRARYAPVTHGFFSVLGVGPQLGRTFTAGEHHTGANPVAVISDRFWRAEFGAAHDVLGRRIQLEGLTFTIVGVMPPSMFIPDDADIWTPVEVFGSLGTRTAHNLRVLARLRPGVLLPAATHEMNAIAAQLRTAYGSGEDATGVETMTLHDSLGGPLRSRLSLLMGAVVCILLIVCLNLSSALLARDRDRSRTLAIRTALGASRVQLVRQLLVESVLLAVCGGVLGLVLASTGTNVILAAVPAGLPAGTHVTIDVRVALFSIGLAIVTGIVFGLVPALRAARVSLRDALANGARGSTQRGGLRAGLVVAEVAIAVVLLTGAGLLVRSLRHLMAVDPGFDPRGVVVAELDVSRNAYATPDAARAYYDRVLDAVRTLPGVRDAGAITDLPLSDGADGGFAIEGGAQASGDADYHVVDGDYFRTMRIPLLEGRFFGDADRPGAPDAVIVSRSLARRYWPGLDPIGRRLRFYGMDDHADRWLTVAGVVGDVSEISLARSGVPTAYIAIAQRPERAWSQLMVVVRAANDADASVLVPSLRARIAAVDAGVPITVSRLTRHVDAAAGPQRFTTVLLGSFAAAAIVLAAVGLYAVLAFGVSERRREIGLRMALGARGGHLVRMIMGQGVSLTLAGLTVGLVLAAMLTRLMSGLLFDVAPTDPLTFAAVGAMLVCAAALAGWLPARRAVRIDPLVVMRGD